jgi:hypothetical protein
MCLVARFEIPQAASYKWNRGGLIKSGISGNQQAIKNETLGFG